MCEKLVITNPKRAAAALAGRDHWFPYYAGFSSEFARQLIASSSLAKRSALMDPWNGSGTTTVSAALNGYKAIGFDLNPVMAVVAKAKVWVLYSQFGILLFSIRLISNSMFKDPEVPDTIATSLR